MVMQIVKGKRTGKEIIMDILDCIMARKSIRIFGEGPIPKEAVQKIIRAAIYAPSGKNGRPWKFQVVLDKPTIMNLANRSIFNKWMRDAEYLIVVFLDMSKSYNRVKDIQSCGAAIQNMLLTACSLEIGSCWIGEVLDYAPDIMRILNITNDDLELMGIVALGDGAGIAITREPRECTKKIDDFLV